MENKEIENRQLLNPNQQDNWPETLKNQYIHRHFYVNK